MGDMKVTLNGTFELEPFRCPITGIPATQDCRCQVCRPDLHWFTNTAAAQTVLPFHCAALPTNTAGPAPGYAVQIGG